MLRSILPAGNLALPVAIGVMFAVSLLNRDGVRRLALFMFTVSIVLTAMTLVSGEELRRPGGLSWGISVQPSEFVKPAFAVIAAWMFAAWRLKEKFPGYLVAVGLYASVVALLLAQPDVGMTVLVSVVWGIQFSWRVFPWSWLWALGYCL